MTRVLGPLRFATSADDPHATMYLPEMAIAATSGSVGSSVQIFARSKMRSTPCPFKFIRMFFNRILRRKVWTKPRGKDLLRTEKAGDVPFKISSAPSKLLHMFARLVD